MPRLLSTATVLLALALACGGDDPLPVEAPDAPPQANRASPTLSSLPRQWRPVVQVGGSWKLEEDCGIDANIVVSGDRIDAGGCGGPITGQEESDGALVLTLQDENSGSSAEATFRWLDEAAGVGTWEWTGCLLQPVPHVDAARAGGMPTAPADCGPQ